MSYINKTEENEENRHLLEAVGDTARLLADLFFMESRSRKIIAASELNNKFKGIMDNVFTDDWFFASDLSKRLKNAKPLERRSSDLKRVTSINKQ